MASSIVNAAQHIGAAVVDKMAGITVGEGSGEARSSLARGEGAGLGDEAFIQARMRSLQSTRTPELGAVMKASKQPQIPPSQTAMSNKPDCGEETYKGSGRMIGLKALVTGGDSGIGRAVCIGFAREGADVAILYNINDTDAEDTARICREAGVRVSCVKADVSSRESCRMAIDRVVAELGGLTTLVCNAAISIPEKAEETLAPTSDHAGKVMEVNALSNIYLAEYALPHFRDHSGCTCILTTSVNAYVGHPNIAYTAAKAAQVGITRSLAKIYAKRGIRINSVAPGPVWTPLVLKDQNKIEAGASFGEEISPMGRAAQPCEMTGAFVFLASSSSSFVTGQTIHIDGGMYNSS